MASEAIETVLASAKTLTFDCYGTLVDWKGGLSRAFINLFGDTARSRLDELFEVYVAVEAQVEGAGFRPYRDVLEIVSARLAERLGLQLDPSQRGYLARALPEWPLFADTNAALVKLKQRYRLGVLSNIDSDLFEATSQAFDVGFDFVVTAGEVRSYKPSPGHFERMLEAYGSPDSTIHVAQSLFHDGAPAARLGLPFVWVNRYAESNREGVPITAEVPDLISLARLVEGV